MATYVHQSVEESSCGEHNAFRFESDTLETTVDSLKTDTVALAVLKFGRHPSESEKKKISEWLQARVGAKKLRLITE